MRFLVLLLLLLPSLSFANAGPFDTATAPSSNPFATSQAIPPVTAAMPLKVTQTKTAIRLDFTLLDKVYLYRPQLTLTPLTKDGKPLALVTPINLPQGTPHEDEVYGKTEVYFHELHLSVPLSALPKTATRLRVGYQGCLENVLCYPPQQLDIALNNRTKSTAPPTNSKPVASQPANLFSVLQSADANQFASWAQGQSLAAVLLLFFLGGLLMAFTPCVFPMFPILLGILAGARKPGPARGFTISLAYVLGMAVPYTLAGLVVAFSGARFNIQASLQQPVFILLAALVFVVLSLSMFGLFELQLPAALRNKLGVGNSNGSLTQAVVIGAISSLIVSPCITPVLAGALLFVAAQGQIATGALALFVLALGMGVPLLIIGAGGASLLPKAGHFMEDIKRFFGLVLLLMAAWLVARLLSPGLALWLYGAVLFSYAILQGAFDGSRRWRQVLMLLLLVYALLLMVGAATGGRSPLTPLAQLTHKTPPSVVASTHTGQFETVPSDLLAQTLADAKAAHTPVLVDFFADWCTACKELERTTLADPAVLTAMKNIRLVRVDITKINPENRQLMQNYHILGLPCLVFLGRNGKEISDSRILGYMNSKQWLDHLNQHVLPRI